MAGYRNSVSFRKKIKKGKDGGITPSDQSDSATSMFRFKDWREDFEASIYGIQYGSDDKKL